MSKVERRLISVRDIGVPLPNKMDQEIASAIDRALFHQKTPAHIRILNTKRNLKDAITAISHHNTAAALPLTYSDIILHAAGTVYKGVIDG